MANRDELAFVDPAKLRTVSTRAEALQSWKELKVDRVMISVQASPHRTSPWRSSLPIAGFRDWRSAPHPNHCRLE